MILAGLLSPSIHSHGRPAGAAALIDGRVEIHVVDSRTRRFVAGAIVSVRPLGSDAGSTLTRTTESAPLHVELSTDVDHVIEVRAMGYVGARIVSPAGESLVEIRLEPRPVSLPDLRATRRGGGPRTVHVLDRESQAVSGDDLGEWLRRLPGFDVTQRGPGGRSLVTVRGSRPEAVEVTLDGVPLTDPLTGVADLSLVPGSTIERVEARAGAGSGGARGGSAGAVRLVSRRPGAGVGAALRMGSHGYVRTEATAGLTAGPLELGGVLTRDAARNDFRFVNRVMPGRPAERRVNADHEGWSSLLRIGLRSAPLRLVARLDGVERGAPGRMGSRLWDDARWRERSGSIGLAYGASPTSSGDGDPRVAATWSGRTQRYLDPRIDRSDSLRADQIVLTGRERLPWRVDADWRGTWTRVSGSAFDGRSERAVVGVLLSRTSNLPAGWSTHAGLGLDGATGVGAVVSPTVGVSWRPRPELHLWARAGQAFRLPSFGDVFLRSGAGARPNPDLRPERVELDSELGGRVLDVDSGLEAGATVFLRLTRDPILWLPSVISVWSPINAGRLRAYGIESSVGWVPARGWKLGVNGTIQSSRLGFDGYSTPLPYHAHLSGSASVERRGPGPDARLDFEIQGPRRTSVFGPHELPTVALIEVRVRQGVTFAKLTAVLEVGVSNVLDAAYERVELFPEPGRRFEVRIDLGAKSPESLQ